MSNINSGAANQKNRSLYDRSNKLGTRVDLGNFYKKNVLAKKKSNMAAKKSKMAANFLGKPSI